MVDWSRGKAVVPPITIDTSFIATSEKPESPRELSFATWACRSVVTPDSPFSPYNSLSTSSTNYDSPSECASLAFNDFSSLNGPCYDLFNNVGYEQFPYFLSDPFLQNDTQITFNIEELSMLINELPCSSIGSPLSSVPSSASSTFASDAAGHEERGRAFYPTELPPRTSRSLSPRPSVGGRCNSPRAGARLRAFSISAGTLDANIAGGEPGVEFESFSHNPENTENFLVTGLRSSIPIAVPVLPSSSVSVNGFQLGAPLEAYGTDNIMIQDVERHARQPHTMAPYRVRPKVAAPAVANAMKNRRKNPAQYVCKFCGSDFTTKQNRNNHINSHLGIKEHKCHCGREFGTRHTMRRHRNSCPKAPT